MTCSKKKGQFFVISSVVVVILLVSLSGVLSYEKTYTPADQQKDAGTIISEMNSIETGLMEVASYSGPSEIEENVGLFLMHKRDFLKSHGYSLDYYYNRSSGEAMILAESSNFRIEKAIPVEEYDVVASWEFNEGKGVVAKNRQGTGSAALYNFSWTAGSGWSDRCVYGKCIVFDGLDDYAGVSGISGFAGGSAPHSIEAWIKVSQLPATRAWILLLGNEAAGSHHWLIGSSGATQFGVWGGAHLNPVLRLNEWTHVVITYDGATMKAYVDGELVGQKAAAFNINGIPLTVAKEHLGEDYFNGSVGNIRVYGKALSTSQVQFLYSRRT